ncbi:MAG TPA: AAA family ATPase, partial [Candidatus Binatia bacterium]|nr:AAA family ATPase [Candidatus Binatia bacterium]
MADAVAMAEEVIRALLRPGFFPEASAVEHLQTHISHVFLAGRHAYKLKKPVRFPFLDFGTPERREHFCREELRLNRRLCPTVYLDVLPITREPDGGLVLAGTGEPVEHVVRMRRLPGDGMLSGLLARDAVAPMTIEQLGALVARFHAGAPTDAAIAAHADPERLRARWDEEMAGLRPLVGGLLAPEEHAILSDFGPAFVRTHETLLRARQRAGHVREGHGDLHAGNVCIVERRTDSGLEPGIYVFDCIEFSPALRANDVASEVAFLAMDLEERGHPDLARRFVDAYVAAARDDVLPVLLPFYGAYRACVRAKVEGLAAADPDVDGPDRKRAEERARRELAFAVRSAWTAVGPAVIVCTGLSGSGKTTLAEALADATGFRLIGSDALRKADDRGTATAGYGTGRYTPAAREAVYDALRAAVDEALATGGGVVADATFIRAADRDRLASVARA